MEQRHDAADHVLCVISDDYLKAPYSTLERNAALWQAAAKRPGFVLLVAVRPCRLPTLSDHVRRCELFGIPEDAARLRLREFMQKRAAPATAAFPGKVFAVSNIPIRVPEHFLGRESSLAAIETALSRYEGRVAITALHGLRGVGKTTLAAAYAERHRGDYRATWWIRAQTADGMRADLVGLGVRLGWVAADEKEEPALAAVRERLRHEGEGILLIYDNALDAEALKPYLPPGGAARVLVTSNAHAWRGVAEPVEIRLWPKEIGADYLVARTGRAAERVAAEALSQVLGGLPLAHEQAAAYCERLEVPLAEYLRRFDAAPARMLDTARDAPAEYHDRLTVAKTFALAIDEAARLHPGAEPLIVHAALLAPEPLPLFLFAEAREKFGPPLASALVGDGLDEAVAALRAFALVDREPIADERDPTLTTDCIRLHRLVRQVAAARRSDEAQLPLRRSLIESVAAVYPRQVWNNPHTWRRARRLDALALALVDADGLPEGIEASAAELAGALAIYRQSALADYTQARRLHERALAINEKVFGPDHPESATHLSNLASAIAAQGDFATARQHHERALTIREKVLGPEHPDTANSLGHIARLLHALGDLAAARTLHERALTINEKVLGPQDPNTAFSLINLANVLRAQGEFVAARPLCERALAICENVLGAEHASTAESLNSLALVLRDQGDLVGAQARYERALAISEKVFGAEHPDTAAVLYNLASLLQAQGELAAARPLSERALAIYEKALGLEHPHTATSFNNLACLIRDMGDAEAAEPLFRRAVSIGEKVLGPHHPDVATRWSNLACLLSDAGRTDEAEPLFLRAIAVSDKALGADHPLTQRYQSHYARLLLRTSRAAEALQRGEAALATHEQVNGSIHPWTKDSVRVTADALDALGHGAEAAVLREKYGIVRADKN